MELFKVIGIKSPGRVDVYKMGQVDLENISDELAEKLWREGCPYLGLTDEGRKKFFPDQVEINITPLSANQPKINPGKIKRINVNKTKSRQ